MREAVCHISAKVELGAFEGDLTVKVFSSLIKGLFQFDFTPFQLVGTFGGGNSILKILLEIQPSQASRAISSCVSLLSCVPTILMEEAGVILAVNTSHKNNGISW